MLKYVQISHELLSEDHQYPLIHFTVNGICWNYKNTRNLK